MNDRDPVVPMAMVRRLAASVTPEELPFLHDPEHDDRDLRPWSALAERGLVTNHPDGPRLTWLGRAVVVELRNQSCPENEDG